MSSKTLRARFSLVLLAMSLAGCANYSGLTTEGVSLDAKSLKAGQSLGGVTLSPAAWPKSDWWKSLGDPQLDGLIREALHDSPDMQIASARAHQASAAAYAADAARMPTLDASGSVSRSRLSRSQDPRGQGDNYSTLRSLTGNFNYTFDLWGGQRDTWEAALGQARAAEIDRQAAQLTLAADVARAYSDLGQAHIVHDLADEDLKRTRQMLELSQKRLSSGIDSQYQYQQTESLEASSEASLIDAEKNLQSAKIALAVLLGKGPDRGNEIARPKVLQASAVALPSVLPAELLGRRPDLVAARWRVAAEARGIEAAKADFYPNVDLLGGLGRSAVQGGVQDFLRYDKLTWGLGPALSLPVYDGGLRRGRLAEAGAGYDLAVQGYNQALVQAIKGVADALVRLKSLREQQHLVAESVDQAQHAFDLAQLARQRGLTDQRAVLEAQPALLQAQRQQQRVRAARLVAQADLLLQLGGGVLPGASGPQPRELEPGEPTLRLTHP